MPSEILDSDLALLIRDTTPGLHTYNILEPAPRSVFDRIVRIAARLFDAPLALVALQDETPRWSRAECKFEAIWDVRDVSFCGYAMRDEAPTVVCDATQDRRFLDNPLVTGGPAIRFYVAAPLRSRENLPLGALCVFDWVARSERPKQDTLDTLMDLAALVTEQLESHAEVAAREEDETRQRAELERAKQTADDANHCKSDFLARMSHEIRTPMNLIMGMNDLLLASPLSEKQRELVEISHRNIRRLLRLINGILDLSKVEAGELVFREVVFGLGGLLKECEATISQAIKEKGLELEMRIDPGVWLYWQGDPERLQQVLLNLLGNAIKFTERGKIAVRVFTEPGTGGQKGLRFEVIDSGCGVPKDQAQRVFCAFQQADESTNVSQKGTGLGLTIAKSLVERMAGKIWLEEGTQTGAKFVFTVFLHPSTELAVLGKSDAASLPSPPATQLKTGMRILLAEDNPESVILTQAYLEGCSVSLDFAADGTEAVEKRKRNAYDLVLMDIQMPTMDGYEATREIRLWEKTHGVKRTPIVALTANALIEDSAISMEAGLDGHLTKPVERRELVEAIARFSAVGGS